MRYATAGALAAVSIIAAAFPVFAQSVTLSTPDGGVEISGRLLGYDGEFFRLDSVYGVLTVDARGVDCDGAGCPGAGPFVPEITISGARGTSASLMPALLEDFASQEGHSFVRQEEGPSQFFYVLSDQSTGEDVARVRFRVTSTAEGFADLVAEAAQVTLAFREPTEAERERALGASLGDLDAPDRGGVVALDALIAVTAPENPLRAIRMNNLAMVVAGKIDNWEELGGPNAPIRLHLPSDDTAFEAGISDRLLAAAGLTVAKGATRHSTLAGLDAAVAADPLALGVTAFSARTDARALALSGSCGASVAPDAMSIKTEDYPLTAPHFAFTPDLRASAFLRDYLAFVRSPAAQPAVRGAGFVDQGITFRSLAVQGERLAGAILATGRDVGAQDLRRMVRAFRGAEQASLSFRFEDGSVDLDTPSRTNVALLAEAITRGDFAGGRLILAGFSDGQGNGATNLDLSRRRAEAVRAALKEMLPDGDTDVTIDSLGFGEAMPMACDEDDWGRQANRRVEVWYRAQ